MKGKEILNDIVRPFNALMKRDKMKLIEAEHDRDLTHKPVLSKHSQ